MTFTYPEAVREFDRQVRELGVKIEPPPARFWEDERWLFEHIAELTQTYPEKWVAVYNKRVVGVGDSHNEAEAAARAQVGDAGPLVIVRTEYKTYVYTTGVAYL